MKSDTQVYEVGNATRVVLQVFYGESQPGSTTTTWQGDVKRVPADGAEYHNNGNPLQGSILFCKSSVKDESPDTNRTSVTYLLSGGVRDQQYPYEVTVPTPGAIAEYAINFVFV